MSAPDDFYTGPDKRVSDIAAIAVIQTTLIDHERRITGLEKEFGKLLFWSMGAALSSLGTFVGLVVTVVIFIVTRHP